MRDALPDLYFHASLHIFVLDHLLTQVDDIVRQIMTTVQGKLTNGRIAAAHRQLYSLGGASLHPHLIRGSLCTHESESW